MLPDIFYITISNNELADRAVTSNGDTESFFRELMHEKLRQWGRENRYNKILNIQTHNVDTVREYHQIWFIKEDETA